MKAAAAKKKAAELAKKKVEAEKKKAAAIAAKKQAAEEKRKKKEEEVAARKAAADEAKRKKEEEAIAKKRARVRAKALTPLGPKHPKLGFKYACFSCDAKFYDLNKPEPVCPKCGLDQRDKPLDSAPSSSAKKGKRAAVRPMAPLLDDDDSTPASDLPADFVDQGPAAAPVGEAMFDKVSEDDTEAEPEGTQTVIDPEDIIL
jgi:hypothetical protein